MKLLVLCVITVFSVDNFVLGAQIWTSDGLLQAEEFDCPTKVPLIENGCNKCFCTDEGELACTINECPENQGKNIEDCGSLDTSWRKGCNKCWCIPIGTVCTNFNCTNTVTDATADYRDKIVIK